MSDHPTPDAGRDALMQGIGELKGTVASIGREVSELRANAVTKEFLEAKVGDTNRFVRGLIAAVLGIVLAAVVGTVVTHKSAPAPAPKIEIIMPTPKPSP